MLSKGLREAMCKQGWGVSCGVHLYVWFTVFSAGRMHI
jgi:hypothetical protein